MQQNDPLKITPPAGGFGSNDMFPDKPKGGMSGFTKYLPILVIAALFIGAAAFYSTTKDVTKSDNTKNFQGVAADIASLKTSVASFTTQIATMTASFDYRYEYRKFRQDGSGFCG